MKRVSVYTDGSARGNPGNGGYGALLRYTDPSGRRHETRFSQGYRLTTNNRMELMGVIVALEALKQPCEVVVRTDSQYVCNAFQQGWIEKWQERNWKKTKSEPVKNVDLWKRLLAAMAPHKVTFEWVKGHAGHAENEECDRLATEAADSGDLIADEAYEGLDQAAMDL